MLGVVIGDSDMVTGFRLVGLEGVEVTSPDEALQALSKELERTDLAFIVISEDFSTKPQLLQTIDRVRQERRNPLIVEIPGSRGKPSEIKMSDLIAKTLGVRL
jgi:vacuolar-type H+-ATPase subunit F/Vma7